MEERIMIRLYLKNKRSALKVLARKIHYDRYNYEQKKHYINILVPSNISKREIIDYLPNNNFMNNEVLSIFLWDIIPNKKKVGKYNFNNAKAEVKPESFSSEKPRAGRLHPIEITGKNIMTVLSLYFKIKTGKIKPKKVL